MEDDGKVFSEFLDVLSKMGGIEAAKDDIIQAETKGFTDRWFGVNETVPLSFVNWNTIVLLIHKETPDRIGHWSTKLVLDDSLRLRLGNLAEPFVDYVNTMRRAEVFSGIKHYEALGFLDFTFTADGSEGYIRTEKPVKAMAIEEDINTLLTGYANHK